MSDSFKIKFRTTLVDLLPRLRHAHPLPYPPEVIYRAAFPESKLADWCLAPIETDFRSKALPYRNLVKCTHRTGTIHFCLNSQAELDAMTDDSDRALFWVTFPRHVVGPVDLGALMLNESMRTDKKLLDWFNAAYLLNDEIDHMTLKIYALSKQFANPSEIALAWPEVVAAVPSLIPPKAKLRVAARSPRIPQLRAEVERYFDAPEMEKITNMLATAIMLPPVAAPAAWVGLFDPFHEDHIP